MKIDTTKIKDFDAMTADEKVNALLSLEVEAKENDEIAKLKRQLSSANSEAKSFKDKWKATLDEKEKENLEVKETLERQKTRIEELEKEKTATTYKASYLAMGYSDEEATQAAKCLVDNDIESALEIQKSFQAAQKQRIQEELLKLQPQPSKGGGNGTPKITPEQFAKMGYTERLKLFNENKELYDELTKK